MICTLGGGVGNENTRFRSRSKFMFGVRMKPKGILSNRHIVICCSLEVYEKVGSKGVILEGGGWKSVYEIGCGGDFEKP